jgi:hypothetical protein
MLIGVNYYFQLLNERDEFSMIKITTLPESLDFIQKVRHEFLRRVNLGTASKDDYSKIIDFFRSPRPVNPYLRDYNNQNFFTDDPFSLPSNLLQKEAILSLFAYFESRTEEFCIIGHHAQYEIWSIIFPTVEDLVKIRNDVENIQIHQKKDNYPDSSRFVRLYLQKLAQSYSILVKLEKQLGIERYLASTGLEYDIQFTHSIVKDIRKSVNKSLKTTKAEFQTQWNLTSISEIIKKCWGKRFRKIL